MGRSPGGSFRFEKNRLLRRFKTIELWDGWIGGEQHLIKRFIQPRSTCWHEFALLSRLKHAVLLKPSCAGYAKDGSFCYGMPVDFSPDRKPEFPDLPEFSLLLLSLIDSLKKKKIDVQWNPDHIVCDSRSGKSYLAGVHPLKERTIDPDDARHLSLLHAFATRHLSSNHELLKIVRKWMRRKESPLSGCLRDLYACFSPAMEKTVITYEWPYTRELELVAGLYRLAEQEKGRALILQGETGEGKTTVLRQIYSDLILRRDSKTILFFPHKEERPFHSIKALVKMIQQSFRSDPGPRDWAENSVFAYVLRLLQESNQVTNILIDQFQNCDPSSKRFICRLFQQSQNLKVLYLVSSDSPVMEATDCAVSLSLQRPVLKQFLDAVLVPLWQEKQRKSFFDQIYARTTGNPLFFQEYLSEVFRSKKSVMKWHDGEWSFGESSVPDFPPGLLEFYWTNAPELDPEEWHFLEIASLKGDTFEASAEEERVVESLIRKNVLLESGGRYRFRKQLFSEAIQKRLSPERSKAIHQMLADQLSLQVEPDTMILLARHYLKAGNSSAALEWARRSIQDAGCVEEQSALVLFQELESVVSSLTPSERGMLFQKQGDVYFRRGKFAQAAISYQKAIDYKTGEPDLQFFLGISIVECHLLQEDIVSAERALKLLHSRVSAISDESMLFRYFVARGVCSHYRGIGNAEDFEKAFACAESLADDALLAHGYRRSAWLLLKQGKLVEASRTARKAIRYAKASRDSEERGHCYKIFASIAWRKSRHEQAEKMMKKSIRAFQKRQNDFGCAGVWNLLGNVYLERYRFTESARCFEKAVALFGQLDHPREVSLAQFNMGLVYLEQGRLKEAEKIFLRCRAIDKASGNKWFYAYDLRALAVYCILQGYPRKATRLLKRTLDICEELKAEGDILQTRMILLFHQLDQRKYKDAHSLVTLFEGRVAEMNEPLTVAEIHHLLAYYYGFLNETKKSNFHLKQSLSIGKRIRHYKLIGKNQILSLIFRGTVPRAEDRDFSAAVRNFKKSKNQLEFADYLLKLYQAYPVLVKEKSHERRIRWMEGLYRRLRIRPRLNAVRAILQSRSAAGAGETVAYGWWQALLSVMTSPQNLESKLKSVLKEVSGELQASYSQVQFLNSSGTFERLRYAESSITNTVEDFPRKILERTMRHREILCLDAGVELELSRDPWVIENEVRSILAIPFFKSGQFLGLWYFERRGSAPVFEKCDLEKAAFFSTACSPLLETALEKETVRGLDIAEQQSRGFEDMVGASHAIREVGRLAEKVAPLDVSVLITGESGTGKELVARNIHRCSKRAGGPFIALNCSAIPETLIESELFGHARGAFTGAVAAKAGSVERAHRGTLFLDEIGDLSAAAQAKLLRVIQEREVQRLGEVSVRKVDVRFVFATHRNLERMIRNGEYREDLFYRISGYTLSVPPLRERKEDIPILVRHFVEKYSQSFDKREIRFSSASMKALCDYSWPGNVREMENLIQTVLVNTESGSVVEPDALPRSVTEIRIAEQVSGMTLEEGRELFERDFVLQALNRNQWNKSRTAKELSITRQGLINMIQRLRITKS